MGTFHQFFWKSYLYCFPTSFHPYVFSIHIYSNFVTIITNLNKKNDDHTSFQARKTKQLYNKATNNNILLFVRLSKSTTKKNYHVKKRIFHSYIHIPPYHPTYSYLSL
eukprot:UN00188